MGAFKSVAQTPRRMRAVLCMAAFALGGWLPAAAQAQPSRDERGPQELLVAISTVRTRGCDGLPGSGIALRPMARLDDTARRIAQGTPADRAAKAAGYRATRLLTISMSGEGSTALVARALAQTYCKQLVDPRLTEVGLHHQGSSWWLVFAAPFSPPAESAAASVAARVLALVNEVRSRARLCGRQRFDAAGPLQPNALLDNAAAVHARDMARHGYLEHRGRDGSSAADRATRSGYRWRGLGENIASGQTTAEQVVREWTASPEHCANLMNTEFIDMGIAFAVDRDSPQGIYWAQELARPR